VALFLVVWALAIGYLYAEEPPSQMHWIFDSSTMVATSHSRAQAAFIRGIPANIALDADPVLGAHLTNRRALYKLWDPRDPRWSSLILVDLYSDIPNPSTNLQMEIRTGAATVAYMRRAGGYALLRADRQHGLYLYANCRHWACMQDPTSD
jgi:hypothetical protein